MAVDTPETVIAVRELHADSAVATLIHDHLDLDIQRGEVVALVGNDGSGKDHCCGRSSYAVEADGGFYRIVRKRNYRNRQRGVPAAATVREENENHAATVVSRTDFQAAPVLLFGYVLTKVKFHKPGPSAF